MSLSPIDTTEVAEPHIWNTSNPSNMGKVDFDCVNGATVVTVQVVQSRDGGYVVHVWPLAEDVSVNITQNW